MDLPRGSKMNRFIGKLAWELTGCHLFLAKKNNQAQQDRRMREIQWKR